jgi:hypothetical protein
VQLMSRLCQVIVGALHELLSANIRVMSAAALASLFMEMNFIEGIIPSSLKNDNFDESIEQSYELMLRRLLELVKRKPPSASSQLGQVGCRSPKAPPAPLKAPQMTLFVRWILKLAVSCFQLMCISDTFSCL